MSLNFRYSPLENIIDDTFVTNKGIEKDSSMHKILLGTFTDPFKDIEEDYAHVDIELIKHFNGKLNRFGKKEEDEQKTKNYGKKENTKKEENITKKQHHT